MKKFYAFAAASLAAVSMNAQLYVCGNGDGLGWTPENPMVIQPNADGSYTFELKNLVECKISTKMGGWDVFNGESIWIDMSEDKFGHEEPYYGGTDNIAAPWTGDYQFVIKPGAVEGNEYAKGLAIVNTTTPKPAATIQDIYIRGGMNGWGSDAAWKFESADGVNYKFVCQGATKISANQNFKIADANWGAVNYGTGTVTIGQEQEWWNNGPDSSVPQDFEGTISFALGAARANITVLFSTETSGIEDVMAEGTEEIEYFNLQGVRVANPENGIFIARQGKKVYKVAK